MSVLLAAALVTPLACAVLANLPAGGGVPIAPPTVVYQGTALARAPSQRQLAAYYCPDVVSLPFGTQVLACEGFFGPRPRPADMEVAFDLRFKVQNPNQVPLPLASVLSAVTVFPAATNQRLGAVCVQLCPDGRPSCGALADPAACRASSRDVRSVDDFVGAAAGLLLAQGIAAASGQPLTFAAPQLLAVAEMDVTVRFSFGPEPLLATLRQLALQSVDELKIGRMPSFVIPFRLEGTIFFDAGSLGRIAVGYGPIDGTWVLPTEGLLPG